MNTGTPGGMQEVLRRSVEPIRAGLKAVAAARLGSQDSGEAEKHYRELYRVIQAEKKPIFPDGTGPKEVQDQWLLGLILIAHLDPETARLMDLAAGESCQGGTALDVLEELEEAGLDERFALRARFSPSFALVEEGWCRAEYSVLGTLVIHPTPKSSAAVFGESFEPVEQDEFVQDRSTSRRLNDLIVSSEVAAEVEELVQAARGREIALLEWGLGEHFTRGLALSALFDGEPGTGKTLCAEVLAGELNRPLQRVNVARLLDKYVGGTQKNIEAAFEEASRTGSVLLFDEADALFARRMQVESSQDRHANLEINLLLEWMERFDGVVVLTTNLRQGMDRAFERRIGYKIHFPFPDIDLREQLWKRLLPLQAPVEATVDFGRLAERYELSGGSIKNALLRAAYKSAASGKPLGQGVLEEAAERECIATGKLVVSDDLDEARRFFL